MGDERPGDPAADDREIAAEVVVETLVDGGEAVGDGPEGSAAGEVTGEEGDGIQRAGGRSAGSWERVFR